MLTAIIGHIPGDWVSIKNEPNRWRLVVGIIFLGFPTFNEVMKSTNDLHKYLYLPELTKVVVQTKIKKSHIDPPYICQIVSETRHTTGISPTVYSRLLAFVLGCDVSAGPEPCGLCTNVRRSRGSFVAKRRCVPPPRFLFQSCAYCMYSIELRALCWPIYVEQACPLHYCSLT